MDNKREYKSRTSALLRRLFFLGPHTCPWWLGYTFDNPLRQFVHKPKSILGNLVTPGDTAVDIGCGLGYFSIALADLVGLSGQVIALDIQSQMVQRARHRAECQGLAKRIDFRTCARDRLGFDGAADFALAFWMLHEVPDPERLLIEVRSFLRPSGHLLIAEPRLHVSNTQFSTTVELTRDTGFRIVKGPRVRLSRCIVCSLA